MKAIIKVDVPEFQIGQEATVYFRDTMCTKGVCEKEEERKTGKWVDDGQYADYHSEHGFHCSVCGGCIIDYVCQVYDENSHCKWCGAKMQGE